jgi:hypothetical protein
MGQPSIVGHVLSENSLRHCCQSKIESRSFDLNVIRKRMTFGAQDDKFKGLDDRSKWQVQTTPN